MVSKRVREEKIAKYDCGGQIVVVFTIIKVKYFVVGPILQFGAALFVFTFAILSYWAALFASFLA